MHMDIHLKVNNLDSLENKWISKYKYFIVSLNIIKLHMSAFDTFIFKNISLVSEINGKIPDIQ